MRSCAKTPWEIVIHKIGTPKSRPVTKTTRRFATHAAARAAASKASKAKAILAVEITYAYGDRCQFRGHHGEFQRGRFSPW